MWNWKYSKHFSPVFFTKRWLLLTLQMLNLVWQTTWRSDFCLLLWNICLYLLFSFKWFLFVSESQYERKLLLLVMRRISWTTNMWYHDFKMCFWVSQFLQQRQRGYLEPPVRYLCKDKTWIDKSEKINECT